jgi:N-acetylglucosamine-6-phosphate deacetylase
VTPAGVLAGEVVIADGLIEAVGPDRRRRRGRAVELGDRWLVPGFIDTHVHGGGDAQCNSDDPDEIAAVARFHARHGTTSMLAAVVPSPSTELESSIRAIARATVFPGVLGIHLEGPFVNPRRRGAMDPAGFLAPDPALAERLLETGRGSVRMMTLAPELPGSVGLVRMLVARGVLASVGHSDATYEQTRAAVAAGARSATHLFNAMRPLDHREPGVIGAALDLPEVNCELICDGVHSDPVALRLVHRLKGTAGVRLVTDAIEAAGMPDGEYRLGRSAVTVAGGRAMLSDGSAIAGSTLTMDAAVRNVVRWLGVTVEQASAMTSPGPARVLGLEGRKGSIARGLDADLVVLDDELNVCATVIAGTPVFSTIPGLGA